MDWIADWFIGFFGSGQSVAGLSLLAAAAAIEYVFPPFPGDTITLFGAFLATTRGWSLPLVFLAVMVGSVAGSMLAFALGHRLRHRGKEGAMAKVRAGFDRYGPAFLLANRFLPGIRAAFFVVAGMVEIKSWHVALYSTISAAAWNLGLLALGSALGANYQTMLAWVQSYSTWAVAITALLAVVVLAALALRRRR